MFVPQGRVLLTVAVDRLAEVRRLAGQINDDARNAAKVELRAEFYSGSSLTTIIHPGTGETHTIFPERWGLEKALTWLEKGECLLTSGLVYPRLGLSFNKDPTVSIFMDEHDLQRLMAKQEVEQEAASRLDVKSPPLSGEPQHVEKPEPEQARPAEPKSLEKKAKPTRRAPSGNAPNAISKSTARTAQTGSQPRQSTGNSSRIKTWKPSSRRRAASGACLL